MEFLTTCLSEGHQIGYEKTQPWKVESTLNRALQKAILSSRGIYHRNSNEAISNHNIIRIKRLLRLIQQEKTTRKDNIHWRLLVSAIMQSPVKTILLHFFTILSHISEKK